MMTDAPSRRLYRPWGRRLTTIAWPALGGSALPRVHERDQTRAVVEAAATRIRRRRAVAGVIAPQQLLGEGAAVAQAVFMVFVRVEHQLDHPAHLDCQRR